MLIYATVKFYLNDYMFFVFVGLYALTGAFANSKCFALAAKYAGKEHASNASYWMNIILYAGVYAGASVPYWVPLIIGHKM